MQVARRGSKHDLWRTVRAIYGEGLPKFWQGLVPALLLTCNPALNYAVFDGMKGLVAQRGKRRPGGQEIVLLGMLSKCIATVITYPLIRAKVIMMADAKPAKANARQQEPPEGASERVQAPVEGTGPTREGEGEGERGGMGAEAGEAPAGKRLLGGKLRLLEVMSDIVQAEGVGGLYIGVDAQVFNTALKNACLLLTKEHIASLTQLLLRKILYGA
jgi:solute carrier family 25 (peroxisomal adenine nucleotide transporter), member 17